MPWFRVWAEHDGKRYEGRVKMGNHSGACVVAKLRWTEKYGDASAPVQAGAELDRQART